MPELPPTATARVADPGHDDFGGLDRDRRALLDRRRALQWVGGASLFGLMIACSTDDSATPESTTPGDGSTAPTDGSTSTSTEAPATSTSTSTEATSDVTAETSAEATAGAEIPDETAGPFPADGSNGPNLLEADGIVRTDLTTSFDGLSGTAEGIPTTFQITIVDASTGSPIPGAAVYLWHCTADGAYSIYEVTDQNYLRGLQAADDTGKITFTSIFPGCYAGRWPHCHFEVYESLDQASAASSAIKTSQLALPQADCETAYSDDRYGDSSSNLGQLSLASDGVFSDGWQEQMATVAGSPDSGYTASLLVRV